jgi:quercetin dioxygenase-like cupin family protein
MRSAAPVVFAFVMLVTLVAGSAQQGALQIHDLAAMAPFPLGRMQARGAMGQTGSIMITELPPGLKTTPHHHHQEQMMLGLSGRMHYLMGDTPQPLPRFTAALALANVRHGNINDTSEPAVCVEFQAVQRPDWFPPHPRRPREGTPEPVSPPAGREVIVDFNSESGWNQGAGVRSKSLVGETMKLTVWQLSSGPGARAGIGGPAVERFFLVVYGSATISEGQTRRELGRETLAIASPSARGVTLSPTPGATGAVVAVYEALPR